MRLSRIGRHFLFHSQTILWGGTGMGWLPVSSSRRRGRRKGKMLFIRTGFSAGGARCGRGLDGEACPDAATHNGTYPVSGGGPLAC